MMSSQAQEIDYRNGGQQQAMDRLTQTQNRSYGPNCWNTALIVSGLVHTIRYTDDSEFWFWLNSPFCQAVGPNAELQTGDIGSVHTIDEHLFHSFVRIDDNTLFQKGGPSFFQHWEIAPHEGILLPILFEEAVRCKGNESTQKLNGCKYKVIYHRCTPAPADLVARYSDLHVIATDVQDIEQRINLWMQTHSLELRNGFYQDLLKLQDILTPLDAVTFSTDKEFAKKALVFRIAGLMMIDVDQIDTEPLEIQTARTRAENILKRYRPQRISEYVQRPPRRPVQRTND